MSVFSKSHDCVVQYCIVDVYSSIINNKSIFLDSHLYIDVSISACDIKA